MSRTGPRFVGVLAATVVIWSCADAPLAPSDDLGIQEGVTFSSIAGSVSGPGGGNVCGFFTYDTQVPVLEVRAYDAAYDPARLAAVDTVTCGPGEPRNGAYGVSVPDGTYHLAAIALREYNDVEPTIVTVLVDTLPIVKSGSAWRDLRMGRGTIVRGSYRLASESTYGATADLRLRADGRVVLPAQLYMLGDKWARFRLQRGIEVDWDCGRTPLGAVPVTANAGTFVVTTESPVVDCRFANGYAGTMLTHRNPHLAVTVFPGRFGIDGPNPAWGRGWGVQLDDGYGLERGDGGSLLFSGGLVLGVGGDILSGADLRGYDVECGSGCTYDFTGNDRSVQVDELGRRRVRFTYYDNGSIPGVSLRVVQTSWDRGLPLVVIRFRIRNRGGFGVTVTPALFMDWDAGSGETLEANDDDRVVNLGSSLFVSNLPNVGTFLIQADSGTRFIRRAGSATPLTIEQQLRMLDGDLGVGVSTLVMTPADFHYWHAGQPRRIRPGRDSDFWVAIPRAGYGYTLPQLTAAATAFADSVKAGLVN